MRGTYTEPAGQPLDLIDAIGAERWAPFSYRLGRVTDCVPGFAALPAQRAQGITQQRPFFVTQALYRLWLGQDLGLQIRPSEPVGVKMATIWNVT
jgi:hypothetical protein